MGISKSESEGNIVEPTTTYAMKARIPATANPKLYRRRRALHQADGDVALPIMTFAKWRDVSELRVDPPNVESCAE